MSSLTRWDPIPEVTSLREAMNRLLEDAVMRPSFGVLGSRGNASSSSYGAMNVFEATGRYYCQVLLPGVSLDNIDLTVRQNILTLKGKITEPLTDEQQKNVTYLVREFGAGEFTRSIAFPKDVQGDDVQARYDNGILAIEIPIAEHAQPRRITIQGANPARPEKATQRQIIDESLATAHDSDTASAQANTSH